MSGQMQSQTILQSLAKHLARPVDIATVDRARLHLTDWIGCAVAGAKEVPGEVLRRTKGQGRSGDAFYWGGLGNILEMDDVDKRAILHPGPAIIPAVLALAEGHNGNALLTAIVRGYEATIRLGRAVGLSHYAFWHSTGTCGSIGAAAASASLLELDEEQTAQAMALALSQAAGLWQTRHETFSMGKQLHTAHAARAGLEAAELAAASFKGPLSILEGEQGFFAAMCQGANPHTVLAEYESDWLIHDVSFKPWPACRHAHPTIDAALELAGQIEDAGSDKIDVRTYGDALKFCDRPNPQTPHQAKFSLQHVVAICLTRGAPQLEDFEMATVRDPEITDIRARVSVSVGEPYASAYPDRYGAEVSAEGKIARVPDALGDPENPVTAEQIYTKATTLMQVGGLDDGQAKALIAQVNNLGPNDSAANLLKAVREALT